MSELQVERLTELTPERRQAILSRSQEDVSAVLEVVAPILAALRAEGDAESLRQHQQFKADITAADLAGHPRGDRGRLPGPGPPGHRRPQDRRRQY